MTNNWAILSIIAVVVSGCCKDEKTDPFPIATSTATTAVATTGTTVVIPPVATTPRTPLPLPAGRSQPPTLDEWNKLKQEVTVKGSSALKCETKMIREYLRVSCKDTNDTGGTPKAIKLVKGGREALIYAGGGFMSLIVPVVEGTDFEAIFSWTDKAYPLVVKWPAGARKPAVVGTFEGARSPLDGTALGDAQKLCACWMKQTGLPDCDMLPGGADPDCDRTYPSNCGELIACASGSPDHWPRCLPGFVNAGAIGRCYKKCDIANPTTSCPPGLSCIEWERDNPLCTVAD